MPNPEALCIGITSVSYSSVIADLDLVAAKGAPCRRIRVAFPGNLALQYADGSTDAFGMLSGETVDVQAAKILASTTATGLTVWW